jgi:hypothetical protein
MKCFQRFLTLIMYTFSTQLQLSNGKCMSIQLETRSCLSGFPLGCCDHNILFIIMITTMYFEIRPLTKLAYFPNSKLWIMLMEIKMFFHIGTKKNLFYLHTFTTLLSLNSNGRLVTIPSIDLKLRNVDNHNLSVMAIQNSHRQSQTLNITGFNVANFHHFASKKIPQIYH